MKKYIGVIVFIIFGFIKLHSQTLPDNFSFGNSLTIFEKDSIKVYFDCTGFIKNNECAEYYRVGKLDSIYCNFDGKFRDYYVNGNLSFECQMINNKLNGNCKYYFPNGRIKEIGQFKDDSRIGVWTYFYPTGKPEKVVNFVNGNQLVVNYYQENGEITVQNGNGEYNGYLLIQQRCGTPSKTKGFFENGKMTGKWTYFNPITKEKVTDEYFENGKFIKGIASGIEYYEGQNIFIQGPTPNEDFNIIENKFFCPGSSFSFVEFKNNQFLWRKFYPEFSNELFNYINENTKNQGVLVCFSIDDKDEICDINVRSSRNDRDMEISVKNVLSKSKSSWKSGQINFKKIKTDILFSVLIIDKKVIIPAQTLHEESLKWLKGEM